MNEQLQNLLRELNLHAGRLENTTHQQDVYKKRDNKRARACYQLKYEILTEHKPKRIEKHYIHNDVYYCFYYSQHSFHIPKEENIININESQIEKINTLQNFSKQTPTKPLQTVVQKLKDEYNYSINEYITQDSVTEQFRTVSVKFEL